MLVLRKLLGSRLWRALGHLGNAQMLLTIGGGLFTAGGALCAGVAVLAPIAPIPQAAVALGVGVIVCRRLLFLLGVLHSRRAPRPSVVVATPASPEQMSIRGKLLVETADLIVGMPSPDSKKATLTPRLHFRNHANVPILFRIDTLTGELHGVHLQVPNPTPKEVIVPPQGVRYIDYTYEVVAAPSYAAILAYALAYGPAEEMPSQRVEGKVLIEAHALLGQPGKWGPVSFRELGITETIAVQLAIPQQGGPSTPKPAPKVDDDEAVRIADLEQIAARQQSRKLWRALGSLWDEADTMMKQLADVTHVAPDEVDLRTVQWWAGVDAWEHKVALILSPNDLATFMDPLTDGALAHGAWNVRLRQHLELGLQG